LARDKDKLDPFLVFPDPGWEASRDSQARLEDSEKRIPCTTVLHTDRDLVTLTFLIGIIGPVS